MAIVQVGSGTHLIWLVSKPPYNILHTIYHGTSSRFCQPWVNLEVIPNHKLFWMLQLWAKKKTLRSNHQASAKFLGLGGSIGPNIQGTPPRSRTPKLWNLRILESKKKSLLSKEWPACSEDPLPKGPPSWVTARLVKRAKLWWNFVQQTLGVILIQWLRNFCFFRIIQKAYTTYKITTRPWRIVIWKMILSSGSNCCSLWSDKVGSPKPRKYQ